MEQQACYYNARHTPREFKAGDIIGLSTRNFRFKTNPKFVPRYIPVKVLQRIGNQAYKVVFPIKYARMHYVFSVSSLEPWTAKIKKMPLPDLEND